MRETEAGPVTTETLLALEARRDGLYAELERCYDNLMARATIDTQDAEDEWMLILREYEMVCSEILEGL